MSGRESAHWKTWPPMKMREAEMSNKRINPWDDLEHWAKDALQKAIAEENVAREQAERDPDEARKAITELSEYIKLLERTGVRSSWAAISNRTKAAARAAAKEEEKQ